MPLPAESLFSVAALFVFINNLANGGDGWKRLNHLEQKMKTLLLIAAFLSSLSSLCWSEPPPDDLVKKLTAVIREHCPDAAIETTNDVFTAKHGTMMFTLHGGSMTGEFSPKLHQREGPNFRGFLLTVAVEKGRYEGQAVVPQELHGPYFPTYISAPTAPNGKDHYWITFSYGGRFDPKLKQAVFAALPVDKFQPDSAANGTPPRR